MAGLRERSRRRNSGWRGAGELPDWWRNDPAVLVAGGCGAGRGAVLRWAAERQKSRQIGTRCRAISAPRPISGRRRIAQLRCRCHENRGLNKHKPNVRQSQRRVFMDHGNEEGELAGSARRRRERNRWRGGPSVNLFRYIRQNRSNLIDASSRTDSARKLARNSPVPVGQTAALAVAPVPTLATAALVGVFGNSRRRSAWAIRFAAAFRSIAAHRPIVSDGFALRPISTNRSVPALAAWPRLRHW